MKNDEPIITPDQIVRYLAKARKVSPNALRLPQRVLLTYTPREVEASKTLTNAKPVEWWPYEGRLWQGGFEGSKIAVSNSYVGSPGAVMQLEELIAHGARKIIEAGLSGGIVTTLQPGDLCIINRAFSDEGTSRHYYPKQRTFNASRRLTSSLSEKLRSSKLVFRTLAAWTTDAVYRETRAKVNRYRALGASLVNMESSSIFAIAKYRKVDAASIQVVSDIVVHNGWKPAFRHERVLENRQTMVRIALHALASGRLSKG